MAFTQLKACIYNLYKAASRQAMCMQISLHVYTQIIQNTYYVSKIINQNMLLCMQYFKSALLQKQSCACVLVLTLLCSFSVWQLFITFVIVFEDPFVTHAKHYSKYRYPQYRHKNYKCCCKIGSSQASFMRCTFAGKGRTRIKEKDE